MHCDVTHYLCRKDPVLRKVIRRAGPCGLVPHEKRSPFESLVRAVAHQQLNGKAAESILNRFIALFSQPKGNGKKSGPGTEKVRRTSTRFPKPEEILAVEESLIRGAGFSQAKLLAIRDIAAKTLDGVIPTSRAIAKLADDDIVERLTQVRGVGRWTVEMLLIFQLGRPDILPADDFGVRNGYRVAYGLDEMPTKKTLLEFGERWRPYRTTASWYLWRAADMHKEQKQ